jgi:hypothetical protein
METQALKIKCLELATAAKAQITISSDAISTMQMKNTLTIAQEYYEWVMDKSNTSVEVIEQITNA